MRRRAGFTITELLVAMALIMLIMAVMAEAFTKSLEAFSALKAIGDMDQKMRAAVVILSRDLSDDHFGNAIGPYTQLDAVPNPVDSSSAAPGPNAGFLAISQSVNPSVNEGNDTFGNPSPRNTTGLLHFTVNRAKNWTPPSGIRYDRRENYFSAFTTTAAVFNASRFPDSRNYYSQVAEVAYFLRDSGDVTPSGAHRFILFRRQAVVLTDTDATALAATSANASNFCDFSWSPTTNVFNKFGDLPNISNRRLIPGGKGQAQTSGSTVYTAAAPGCAGPIPIYAEDNTSCSGNDLLLSDVLSFTIQVMRDDITPLTFSDVSYFDTAVPSTSWSPAVATPYKIKAIQIIIRVWDPKAQAARQISIVQDM